MNEISLFSVNTVTHCIHMRAHTDTLHMYKQNTCTSVCMYIWSKRESLQIHSVSERVANCMAILFTFYLPALSMKYAI